MKKYFTFFLMLILFAIRTFAQDTIPNASFERWTSHTGYEDPVGWTTPNSITVGFGGSAEVTKTDTFYKGSFAARLETDTFVAGVGGGTNIPGFVLLGSINILEERITGGVPFTGRPDSLYGYCRYAPASGKVDSALAFIFLSRWNSTSNTRDTVAAGGISFFGSDTIYTQFYLPITYLKPEIPDTMQLAIASSSRFLTSTPPLGSILFLDDLYFSTSTGINTTPDKGFSVSCYPNPVNKNLNILISEPRTGTEIKVYDALGRNILSTNNEGLITSIDVSQLSNGIYFYEVIDSNGNSLKSDKFTVVR